MHLANLVPRAVHDVANTADGPGNEVGNFCYCAYALRISSNLVPRARVTLMGRCVMYGDPYVPVPLDKGNAGFGNE